MGHQALGQFIVLQGNGDMGEKTASQTTKRTYRSIFGIYELERVVYGSREGQKVEFVEDFRQSLPTINPGEEHEIIVTTADGKGVPVLTKVKEKR